MLTIISFSFKTLPTVWPWWRTMVWFIWTIWTLPSGRRRLWSARSRTKIQTGINLSAYISELKFLKIVNCSVRIFECIHDRMGPCHVGKWSHNLFWNSHGLHNYTNIHSTLTIRVKLRLSCKECSLFSFFFFFMICNLKKNAFLGPHSYLDHPLLGGMLL